MTDLETDGFTVIEDYLSAAQLQRFRDGLAPYLGTYRGRNPFEGLTTERVYTLVGRGKVFEEAASDARLLAILDQLLAPNYLLSADHAICIYPGEKRQGRSPGPGRRSASAPSARSTPSRRKMAAR
jgi:hypothetical protein